MKPKRHSITASECHSIACMRRPKHNIMLQLMHHKHKISYRTLFYMKEYGPRSHVTSVIINQSIKILMLACLMSMAGGLNIKSVENQLIKYIPLLILLPALTTMIGSFGTIVASKFTTMLFMGKIGKQWWKSKEVHELIITVFFIAVISVFYIAPLSYLIAFVKGFQFNYTIFFKVVMVAFLATFILVGILIAIAAAGSFYIYKKKEDPNNFMIPITTSVADLGTLVLFTYLVMTIF